MFSKKLLDLHIHLYCIGKKEIYLESLIVHLNDLIDEQNADKNRKSRRTRFYSNRRSIARTLLKSGLKKSPECAKNDSPIYIKKNYVNLL